MKARRSEGVVVTWVLTDVGCAIVHAFGGKPP